ncbi:MAG: hypothetical protein GY868_18210 [Deltaproteobacteria bacterium]|nr:hypothetical protein [Deltaproteobacteria bacterium]
MPASVSAYPGVSIDLEPARVSVGRDINLYIRVAWEGDAEEYVIVPPSPELPEGFVRVSSSFSSTVTSNSRTLDYHIVLRSEKTGTYVVGPVEIRYWARGAKEESTVITGEVPCEVVTFAFLGPHLMWYIIGAAVVLVALLAGIAWMTNQRLAARKQAAVAAPSDGKHDVEEQLSRCRECRLRGDYGGFYAAALQVARELAGEEEAFLDGLRRAEERVRFGGDRSGPEELERVMRHLEKRAAERSSGKSDNEREYQKYCR